MTFSDKVLWVLTIVGGIALACLVIALVIIWVGGALLSRVELGHPEPTPTIEELRGPDYPSFQWALNGNAVVVRNPYSRRIELVEFSGAVRELDFIERAGDHNSLMISVHPAGSHIAYLSNYDSGEPYKFRPWIAELSQDSQPYRLGSPEPEYDMHSTNYLPVWSPSGDRVAFFTAFALHVAEVNSFLPDFNELIQQGHSIEIASCVVDCRDIAWSPDGRHVAFAGMVSYVERGVFIADSYGSGPVQLNVDEGSMPAWSSDSRALAFAGFNHLGLPAIYTADSDGSDIREVHLIDDDRWGVLVTSLSWSPDGSTLLFTLDQDKSLHFVDLNTAGAPGYRAITPREDVEYAWGVDYADWTPDGSRVLVYVAGSGVHLYTVAPDGSDIRWLVGGG